MNDHLTIVGIVGGVACGKSAVAQQFGRLGAHVIDGDKLGHEVLRLPEVVAAARKRWGPEAVDAKGNASRSCIAARVFPDTENGRAELEFWEGVTHPRIAKLMQQRLDELPVETIVVLDAAVMFKAGWDKQCDHVVYVDVPREERLRRAVDQRGWSEEQFDQREAAQLPTEEKRRRATAVIDNSGSLDKTYVRVVRFWESRLAKN